MLDVSAEIKEPQSIRNLSEEIEALQGKINTISVEFNELLSKIGQVQKCKAKAKTDYQAALDGGFEDKMSDCLAMVRQANEEIESLKSQIDDFPGKIVDLYDEQRELVKAARAERPKAEAALKLAQEDLRACDAQISKAGSNLLGAINQLNDTVNNATRSKEN